jgi:4-diphosphocytidyl-2-C-methyl-D-erythritol kinase
MAPTDGTLPLFRVSPMFIQRIPAASPAAGPGFLPPGLPARVAVWAPAKVNLFLEVLAPRPDGYHEIATLLTAVDLYDTLTLDLDPSGGLSLTSDRSDLSVGPDNLILRAANLLKIRTGCPKGAAIHLTKRIPWAAGLGGGSSDAAAALAGLNDLWELGRSKPELAALGAELGSDVPFFFDTPAAWCTGRGEVVTAITLGRPLDFVLVCPEEGLSTAEVYRELVNAERGTRNAEPKTSSELRVASSELAEALAAGDVEWIARGMFNRLEEAATKLCPSVALWLRRLRQTEAAGCLLSGSGSCVFALCRDGNEALRVADAIRSTAASPGVNEFGRTRVYLVRSCV